MPKDFILIFIIFIAIVLTIMFLIAIFLIREKKYKTFVLANSSAIKNITSINEKYEFKSFDETQSLHYCFDNKKNWYNTEPITYLSREIRHNLILWSDLRRDIEYNREKLKKYSKEVGIAFVPIDEESCTNNKKRFKKCLKTEKQLFDSLTQKPPTDISIKVDLQYVSPQKKVNIHKNGTFSYTEIARILDSVSTIRVDRETYEKLAKVERTLLSDSMRYEVMKRDSFKCVLCGMSSKDGAILHVDHIVPIAKGGKTEMSNLQTLCEKCNIGKSDKLDENKCPKCGGDLALRHGKDGSSFYGCSNYPECKFTKKA